MTSSVMTSYVMTSCHDIRDVYSSKGTLCRRTLAIKLGQFVKAKSVRESLGDGDTVMTEWRRSSTYRLFMLDFLVIWICWPSEYAGNTDCFARKYNVKSIWKWFLLFYDQCQPNGKLQKWRVFIDNWRWVWRSSGSNTIMRRWWENPPTESLPAF